MRSWTGDAGRSSVRVWRAICVLRHGQELRFIGAANPARCFVLNRRRSTHSICSVKRPTRPLNSSRRSKGGSRGSRHHGRSVGPSSIPCPYCHGTISARAWVAARQAGLGRANLDLASSRHTFQSFVRSTTHRRCARRATMSPALRSLSDCRLWVEGATPWSVLDCALLDLNFRAASDGGERLRQLPDTRLSAEPANSGQDRFWKQSSCRDCGSQRDRRVRYGHSDSS